ncbi:MAG: amino acid adenylation domain-containing protein, partial [Betaproteobacteria bacterium]
MGPESTVSIWLERDATALVAILATLKVGAAYLPIDLEHPVERINHQLQDSRSVLLISRAMPDSEARPTPCEVLYLSDDKSLDLIRAMPCTRLTNCDRILPLTNSNLAYIIYTSGSTGLPKGVAVSHASVVNFLESKIERMELASNSRLLQFASLAFDASVAEIFSALVSGATLVLPFGKMSRQETVEHVPSVLKRFAISHAILPPALVDVLEPESFASIDVLLVAGESCPPSVVTRVAHLCKLMNAYGPTENAVCASMTPALSIDSSGNVFGDVVAIGTAFDNVQMYVLDEQLEPVPRGVIGELYLAGSSLARGYINQSGLTSQRFIANPFAEEVNAGTRIYRTGDLARIRVNGEFEFLGRLDTQVKIHGHRIELGEIESALLKSFPEVAQAVVLTNPQLVAYVVPRAGLQAPSIEVIAALLDKVLPSYMIPEIVIVVSVLPLNANGKIDRSALLALKVEQKNDFYQAPNKLEELALCELFATITSVERVGIDDRFFSLGGDSISAIRLVSMARRKGLLLSVRDVFSKQTPRALAGVIQHAENNLDDTAKPDDQEDGEVFALPIQYEFLDTKIDLTNFHQSFCLIAPLNMTQATAQEHLRKIVEHHHSLRMFVSGQGLSSVFTVTKAAQVAEVLLPVLDLGACGDDEQDEAISRALSRLPDRLRPSEP